MKTPAQSYVKPRANEGVHPRCKHRQAAMGGNGRGLGQSIDHQGEKQKRANFFPNVVTEEA